MKRLVVVSNRLPAARPVAGSNEVEIPAGGLANAVFAALRRRPDSLWLGWSGKVEAADRAQQLTRQNVGGVDLLGLPLTQREVSDYYHGFCNAALWPLFHCFQGRTRLDLRQEAVYRGVQVRFAAALRPLLRPDDLVWVQDYHFLLLGQELRRLGWQGRIGFFLHIPFPPHDLWQMLPDPPGFLGALLQCDVVGFQATGSLDNYLYCCRRELQARVGGGRVTAGGRSQKAGIYPVGIDPEDFLPPSSGPPRRRRRGVLARVVRGRRLILGVDRLDYTKGIPERLLAYEEFLKRHPEWHKKVSFIQIASPSRVGVAQYIEQKRIIEALVGRIGGELAEHDWAPIRYLNRSYPRHLLAGFYREADVGLVTPLRDGMNLVAKEFVAAQHPESPGVLVLSRSAGAAEHLPEAVIVNPAIPADVAEGIARALCMAMEERRERHRALLARVLRDTVGEWERRFVEDLEKGQTMSRPPADDLDRRGRPEPLATT